MKNNTVDVPPATLAWPNPAALQVLHLRRHHGILYLVTHVGLDGGTGKPSTATERRRPLRSGDADHHVAVVPDGGRDSNPTDQPAGRNRTDQELAGASQVVRGSVGLSAPVRQGAKSGGWVRHSQNLALPSLA